MPIRTCLVPPILTPLRAAWLIGCLLQAPQTALMAQNQAANNPAFGLRQAIDYALKQNVAVENARLDEQSADQKVREITSIGFPQVSATYGVSDNFIIQKVIVPDGSLFNPEIPKGQPLALQFQPRYGGNAAVTIRQLLFDGSYLVGLQAVRTYRELAIKNSLMTRTQVVEQVKKAYFGALVSFERLRTLDAALQRIARSLAELETLNREGLAEQLDVDRLRVQQNNLRSQREKVAALCDISLNLLKFQMGYPVGSSIQLSDSLSMLMNLRALPLEAGFDIGKRPEMQLLMLQQAGLNLEVKNLKAGYLPSLALQAQRGALAGSNTFSQVRDPGGSWYAYGSLGFGVNWNVFDSFTKKYKIQQKKIDLLKSQNTTEQFRQAAVMEEAHAIIQMRNQIRSLEAQEDNLRLSRQVLSVTQVKYREGVGSGLEVTAAESALTEAESGYFGAVYDWLMARVDLEKARGALLEGVQ